MNISFLNLKTFENNSSQVWREIVSRWGQADYADLTKRQEHLNTLKLEWDAKEYARNRKSEYPDTGSQFNKIYDDGVTKWKAEMVDPVKTKWPKDNSGPVE
jgi:hypothetical protein